MNKESRFQWADNLRFIALVSVIILHVSATGLYFFDKIALHQWLIADFTDSAVRYAAPLFFMISGALLLRNNDKPGHFFKKRFTKILYPFVFWSVIYTLIFSVYLLYKGENISFPVTISNFLFYKGIFAQSAYHLWYVYIILGIYLITPFLKRIFVNQRQNILIHFIVIWIIIILLNTQLFEFDKFVSNIFIFSGYVCYFVSGYYLSKIKRIFNIKARLLMWCALLFLIFFTAIATYLVTFENGDLDEEFFNYQSPNIVLMSVLSFILISNLNLHHIIYLKIRDMVNKYSYGIYLLHALVLLVVEKLGLGWNFIHPLVGIPVGTLLTLSISFVIIFFLNKIPFLGRFAG